jgi:transformation/transcription domain-associated protein
LFFYIPVAVPLSPHLRLLESDPSQITLQDIYEQHCREVGMSKDEPVLTFTESLRALVRSHDQVSLIALMFEER